MNLKLIPVTNENWRDAVFLTTDPERKIPLDEKWITSNAYSMLQCIYDDEWDCRLLMDGDQAVGFAFYGLLPEENRAYLCRYMMDVNYQNQGYGKAFLPLVLELIRNQYGQKTVYTSVHDENPHAKHLYEEFGFQPTEEMDGEERVYVLLGETI
ncbi:MAG: GNAT family N-acetyltransferase [Oscillospiraceae bacterium]|nr:GNAT family N-acetyltransferase [Oscillospiraceae bacterium]